MSKSKNTISDIFVNKVTLRMWNILTKKDIQDLWLRSGWSTSRIAYAMGILSWKWLIERLASSVYMVKDQTQEIDIWKVYWNIIHRLISLYSPSGGIIGWDKPIEFHLQNYSIPDVLIIYTRDTALRVKLSDNREVHFRTLVSWIKTDKKNLWRTLVNNAITIEVPEKLEICNYELALFESLSLRRHDIGIEEATVVRFLRSYGNKLDRDKLGILTQVRYIRSLNRLRILARDLWYTDLYKITLEIIRNEWGGCYLNI